MPLPTMTKFFMHLPRFKRCRAVNPKKKAPEAVEQLQAPLPESCLSGLPWRRCRALPTLHRGGRMIVSDQGAPATGTAETLQFVCQPSFEAHDLGSRQREHWASSPWPAIKRIRLAAPAGGEAEPKQCRPTRRRPLFRASVQRFGMTKPTRSDILPSRKRPWISRQGITELAFLNPSFS